MGLVTTTLEKGREITTDVAIKYVYLLVVICDNFSLDSRNSLVINGRHRQLASSTLTQAAQVFVAAIKKRNKQLPVDPQQLYEVDDNGKPNVKGTRKLVHTLRLR
jgi:hypothetical protein